MEVSPLVWAGFILFILAMLGVDLYMHRDHHAVTIKEAAIWSAVWIALGTAFSAVIWVWGGGSAADCTTQSFLTESTSTRSNGSPSCWGPWRCLRL